MKSENDSKNGLDDLYQDYWAIHAQKIGPHSPLEIAAVLVAQAMSIYRTVLDDEDYNKMVDDISRMRGDVKAILPEDQHYH